jgi:ATP-dependent Clp protease ATP-binding subunit ClpX
MVKQVPIPSQREAQTPRAIYQALDRYVIGQELAKRALAIAAYNHYKRISLPPEEGGQVPLKKSNVLLIGPSGCGKTHLARNIGKILDVPFAVVDATEYTEAGYYGKDVEVMLGELLHACDLSVERAQQGIVFIDEIDKIARRGHAARTGAGSRDIGGEGVQQSLLKLLEGTTVFVPYNVTQHWSKHDFVQMNTHNILFICAGTFTDLKHGRGKRISGFKKGEPAPQAPKPFEDRVQVEDLIEYGMITELMGRLPVIVELADLSEDELVRVMTDPPDSLIKEYQKLFLLDNVELSFDPQALLMIARHARRKKLGARALRAVFEDVMHDFMFDSPQLSGQKVRITASDVGQKLP